MSKGEFVLWCLTMVAITVLVVTSQMGFVTTLADTARTEIAGQAHASDFASTTASLKYWPLFLYLIPFLWGFKAIVNKLTGK